MIESCFHKSARHTTHYLAAGPKDGPLMIFVHGWPELSISWRHQLPVFAGLGFRAVAPDMRGYGQSSIYRTHDAYAQREVVRDMLNLLDGLGRERAIWVGHDWGSPTVWILARLYPERSRAVASLCVPPFTLEQGLDHVLRYVDRNVYPGDTFPYGQWDYMKFYEENFARATEVFDADPLKTAKVLFRKGSADSVGQPSGTSMVRCNGGWFGHADVAPDFPRDDDVVSETDLASYAEALKRNSFFGPDSYYMNHLANTEFTKTAADRLTLPVLFLHARFDAVCETMISSLASPMRERCSDLVERVIDSGHWMAQEKPEEVNAALADWLMHRVPGVWRDLLPPNRGYAP